jgi:hypothetical protein
MFSSPLSFSGSASPATSDFSNLSIVTDSMDVASVVNPSQVPTPQVMADNLPHPPHPRWYIQDDNVEFMVRRVELAQL